MTSLCLTLRAPRPPKQKPALWGVHLEKLGCGTHKPNHCLPWEKLEAGRVSSCAESRASSKCSIPISLQASVSLASYSAMYRSLSISFGILTRAICSLTVVGSVCWRQESPGFLLHQSCWYHPVQGPSCLTLWGGLDLVTFLFIDKRRSKVLKTANPPTVSCFLFWGLKTAYRAFSSKVDAKS